MRLLRKLCQATVLLLCAIVGLSLLRIARTPAQAGPGGGPAAARNGDVNCDGRLDISDSISILNWLFSDGPEPCAIAQTDTCCEDVREEVAALRSTVEALASRMPGPQDIVSLRGELSFPAQGGDRTMFRVPEDKWFVMTTLGSGGSANFLYISEGESNAIMPGFSGPGGWTWTTGLALPPGSELMMSYPSPFTNPPSPFTSPFYLNGYLSGE